MGGCASAQRDPGEELNNAAPAPEPAREEVGEENEGMKKSLQSLFNEMDKKEESSKKENTEEKEASKTKDDKEVKAPELQKEEPGKEQHDEHVKDDIKENTTESKTRSVK